MPDNRRQYRAVHVVSGRVLLPRVLRAPSPLALLIGLAGTGGGVTSLWLPHTSSVHTFGMGFPLDILFLDSGGRCLRVDAGVPPGRLVFGPRGCRSVLETKTDVPGVFDGVRPGDALLFQPLA